MAQNASSNAYVNKLLNGELWKGMMPSNAMFPFDISAMLETQRRNLQALTEAQQIAFENLQAIAQRQSQILSQLVEDNTTIAQQIMGEGTPEEKVTRQADLVRDAYERSVSSMTDLADLVSKSSRETGEVINKRVTASLTEFKSTMEKAKTKAAA